MSLSPVESAKRQAARQAVDEFVKDGAYKSFLYASNNPFYLEPIVDCPRLLKLSVLLGPVYDLGARVCKKYYTCALMRICVRRQE